MRARLSWLNSQNFPVITRFDFYYLSIDELVQLPKLVVKALDLVLDAWRPVAGSCCLLLESPNSLVYALLLPRPSFEVAKSPVTGPGNLVPGLLGRLLLLHGVHSLPLVGLLLDGCRRVRRVRGGAASVRFGAAAVAPMLAPLGLLLRLLAGLLLTSRPPLADQLPAMLLDVPICVAIVTLGSPPFLPICSPLWGGF